MIVDNTFIPEGYISLKEAVEEAGRSLFDDEWTGEERHIHLVEVEVGYECAIADLARRLAIADEINGKTIGTQIEATEALRAHHWKQHCETEASRIRALPRLHSLSGISYQSGGSTDWAKRADEPQPKTLEKMYPGKMFEAVSGVPQLSTEQRDQLALDHEPTARLQGLRKRRIEVQNACRQKLRQGAILGCFINSDTGNTAIIKPAKWAMPAGATTIDRGIWPITKDTSFLVFVKDGAMGEAVLLDDPPQLYVDALANAANRIMGTSTPAQHDGVEPGTVDKKTRALRALVDKINGTDLDDYPLTRDQTIKWLKLEFGVGPYQAKDVWKDAVKETGRKGDLSAGGRPKKKPVEKTGRKTG